MAGFGIVMEYLFFGVAGIVAAVVAAVILVTLARLYVPPSIVDRKKFFFRCARTPFVGWAWVLFAWVVYSYVLGLAFHRDNGMSPDRHAPMPNGYIVGNHSYAFGYLLGPGEKRSSGSPKDGPDSVASITYLQESEPYLLGSRFLLDRVTPYRASTDKRFFFIDTRTHEITRFDSIDELKSVAAAKGVTVSFNEQWSGSCGDAYQKYRPTWFDWFFPIFSIAGLVYLMGSLYASARRLRKQAHSAIA